MRKNGFTLIELLAVITILSIITLVASISVSNMFKESKTELSSTQIESIKESAKSWSSDNMDELPTNNSCSFIILKDLKEDGLLDSSILDPKDRKEIPNNMKIKITSKINGNGNSILTYEVNSKNTNECTYIGSNMYVNLPEGLTPVLYDKKLNSWRVPNINEEWYNYDKQEWANAVVLGSGKTKKPGDTVAVDGTEALMMLVYIPRYEYKIEGEYGTHTDGTEGTQELPGEIEVKFVNTNQTKSDENYIMHPAFTFGDKELNGIWVGKFELSSVGENLSVNNNLGCSTTNCTNSQYLRTLPNISSLRYNSVSNFWYGIKSIENTQTFGLNNMDTHMMKNSEWGAVAYLSQSKYGKYGNKDYEGSNREVYQNKSDNYITGNSNGTVSIVNSSKRDQQCSYNDMTELGNGKGQCGPGASTTGNIYGIYDMSGGAYEYMMSAYGDNQGIYSGYSASNNSGFNGRIGSDNENVTNGAQVPDSKYYDKYTNSTNSSSNDGSESCNNGNCLGHAMSETASWYGDYTYMVYSIYPWVIRGGNSSDNTGAGVFNYGHRYGDSSSSYSTRFVGIVK